jgi:hypothetical protein
LAFLAGVVGSLFLIGVVEKAKKGSCGLGLFFRKQA